jgi:hypothetical protein
MTLMGLRSLLWTSYFVGYQTEYPTELHRSMACAEVRYFANVSLVGKLLPAVVEGRRRIYWED